MYDELVKRLRSATTLPVMNALCQEAADAIERLQYFSVFWQEDAKMAHENELKWIPVTERLPGAGEIVLVYGKRGGIYTAEHNRNARCTGSFWKLNSKSHHCEPTHWMQLPKAPKNDIKNAPTIIPAEEGET